MASTIKRRKFLKQSTAACTGAILLRPALLSGASGEPAPGDLRTQAAACPPPTPAPLESNIVAPPPGSFYHGVYPGHCQKPDSCARPDTEPNGEEDDVTLEDLRSYTGARGAGRDVAWVYFSNNWGKTRCFPAAAAEWIRQSGSVPFIRLMLRTTTKQEDYRKQQTASETVFTLENINRGDFDRDLRAWGAAARDFGSPLIVEWGTEMNGAWFHWNGWWHGKEQGPPLFREAFRRIVGLVRGEGARNVTWVFHPSGGGEPDASAPGQEWNRMSNYYPGDDFVDWIGLSVYGAQEPLANNACTSFVRGMDRAMSELCELKQRRPVFVLEFGATGGHPGCDPKEDEECEPAQCNPSRWADDALTNLLSARWPEVRGFSWWNETWEDEDEKGKPYVTNMRVQTVKGLSAVFQKHLKGNAKVIDRPRLAPVGSARPAEAAPRLKLLVPAYFNPSGGSGLGAWDALLEASRLADIVAVANPASGPGRKRDPQYQRAVGLARERGVQVIGYVSTRYGRRSEKDVRKDLKRWLDWYPGVSGIFFDEQASEEEKDGQDLVAHYRRLFRFARDEFAGRGLPQGLVFSNPGTLCSQRYLTEAGADVLCLFEDTDKPEGGGPGRKLFRNFSPPEWMQKGCPDNFAALVLQVESRDTMKDYLRLAAGFGFRYVYVTDRPQRDPEGERCQSCNSDAPPAYCSSECDPWNALASYWPDEAASARGVVGPAHPAPVP